jgi:hypothetical protein
VSQQANLNCASEKFIAEKFKKKALNSQFNKDQKLQSWQLDFYNLHESMN